MSAPAIPQLRGRDPADVPLDEFDVSHPWLYWTDNIWPYFERLRAEDPVNYCKASPFGPYWSVTKYKHIMEVEAAPHIYSSEPAITLQDNPDDLPIETFIAMDPPRHDDQRKAVQPAVAPRNLATLEPLIRERIGRILDELPIGETFNWVDRVSVELTTQMLATLFDFPFEDRRRLTFWSDATTAIPGPTAVVATREEQFAAIQECMQYFLEVWKERADGEPGNDFISMLAHNPATQNMSSMEYLGNLILLIVGGNDTTRNSLSGGVLFLNQNPAEYDKLRADHGLIPSLVSEIIRYQTPVVAMRRTATQDTILAGKHIRKGEKVMLWYVSGNRDDEAIDNADAFIIDRERPRQHLSFGFGIHRCMGNRLAEMQLRVTWEEVLKRFAFVEVVGEPERTFSSLIRGYTQMPVRLHPL